MSMRKTSPLRRRFVQMSIFGRRDNAITRLDIMFMRRALVGECAMRQSDALYEIRALL